MSRRFRAFGLNEAGSALAFGVILLGVFSLLFAAGVRQEGNAQELDIHTAHHRKALDVARGAIDEMLELFFRDFDLGDCEPINDSDPDENWDVVCTAAAGLNDSVWITAKAGVAGVHETVKVRLDQYLWGDLLGQGTLVVGGDLEVVVDANQGADGIGVYGDAYIGGSKDLSRAYGRFDIYGNELTHLPDPIPTPDEMRASVMSAIDDIVFEVTVEGLTVGPSDTVVIDRHTRVTKKSIAVNGNLVIMPGCWLVADKGITANGGCKITVDGTLVVIDGKINMDANQDVPISGNGTIICLTENQKLMVELTEGERSGMAIICTNNVELTIAGTPPAENSLFVYGNNIECWFERENGVDIVPCTFMSYRDTKLWCKGNAGLVNLRGGNFEWDDERLPFGDEDMTYRITYWEEGNS